MSTVTSPDLRVFWGRTLYSRCLLDNKEMDQVVLTDKVDRLWLNADLSGQMREIKSFSWLNHLIIPLLPWKTDSTKCVANLLQQMISLLNNHANPDYLNKVRLHIESILSSLVDDLNDVQYHILEKTIYNCEIEEIKPLIEELRDVFEMSNVDRLARIGLRSGMPQIVGPICDRLIKRGRYRKAILLAAATPNKKLRNEVNIRVNGELPGEHYRYVDPSITDLFSEARRS